MSIQEQIKEVVTTHPIVLFMKGTKQFSAMRVFFSRGANFESGRLRELCHGERAGKR